MKTRGPFRHFTRSLLIHKGKQIRVLKTLTKLKIEQRGNLILELMPDMAASTVTSRHLHFSDTTGVGARQGFSIVALHTCLIAFVTVFGFCLQLKFPNVSPYETAYGTLMMNLFITVICFYIGSLAVMAIQAARSNADLEDLMNKFSLLLGTLSLIIELLFLFAPLGWIVLFFWSIFLVCFLSNSFRSLNTLDHSAVAHLVQDFGELRQKLVDLNRRLMESNAAAAVGRAYQNLKDMIIRTDGSMTENDPQNHSTELNQNHTSEVPVSIV